jgi:predicted DNA-binding transcriptional regulator YafY
MRKEPATRLLQLARQFAAEPAGMSLDEIATRFEVSRRTAERMRDAIAIEEVPAERAKRWRLPNGLSAIFREPLADEIAALRGVARRLQREGLTESAALIDSLAGRSRRPHQQGPRGSMATVADLFISYGHSDVRCSSDADEILKLPASAMCQEEKRVLLSVAGAERHAGS